MRKAEEPGSLASHQRSNRTKLPLFILLEGSSLWLLPAGRSDSGQILHPQPVAVASIAALLPNTSVGAQEGEGSRLAVKQLQMCSWSSAGPVGSPAQPTLDREAWSPFHPLWTSPVCASNHLKMIPAPFVALLRTAPFLCLLHRHHVPLWELAAPAGGLSEEVRAEACRVLHRQPGHQ